MNKLNYLKIASNVILYTTKNATNVLIKNNNTNESKYNYFSVNDSGKKIIERIRGSQNIEDFKLRFIEEFSLATEEGEWIESFIQSLVDKNVVVFQKEPIETKKTMNIGSDKIISPMHATVEVTDRCNLKCKHCYVSATNKNNKMLSYSNFEKIVEDLTNNYVINIELTGGELFVNPEIYEILKLSYEKFEIVGILTNGTILEDRSLQLIKQNKERTIINISIDSVDAKTHDSFRGVEGSYEKTCQTAQKLKEAKVKFRIASSIFEQNMWEVDKLADLSIELGAEMFAFNFVENFGRGQELHGDIQKNINGTEYSTYISNILIKYRDLITIENLDSLNTHNNCGAGTSSIVIDAEGYIKPCVLSSLWLEMGNLLEDSFSNIMKRDIFEQILNFKSPSKENGCPQECKDYYICRGCFLRGFQANTKRETPCEWILENELEEKLLSYIKANG